METAYGGAVLGAEKTVVEEVEFDEGVVVVAAEGMTRAAVSVGGGGRWTWG